MANQQYPKPGDRVGVVSGPGQFPKDNAGIVIALYDNAWYRNQALILMDCGRIDYMVGAYTKVGIGRYLLQPAKVTA